jgi:hypothetical protein
VDDDDVFSLLLLCVLWAQCVSRARGLTNFSSPIFSYK